MRKILAIAAIVVSAAADAQWIRKQVEADELTGAKAGIQEYYVDEEFQFGPDNEGFWIVTKHGIFDYKHVERYKGCNVLIGLYKNDKLVEKFNMWLDYVASFELRTRRGSYMSKPVGQDKKVKKIMNTINDKDGYIRIIAPRHERNDLDARIPYKNIE